MNTNLQYDAAYLQALRYLQYRPRSVKETKDYLVKHHVHVTIIEQIIAELIKQKFLNDVEFARMWVRSRVLLRPKSAYMLQVELLQKGIDKEVIMQVVTEEQKESGSDSEMAKRLLLKKKEKYQKLSKEELYRKAGGFLGRRGFSYDVIKRSIDEIFGQ